MGLLVIHQLYVFLMSSSCLLIYLFFWMCPWWSGTSWFTGEILHFVADASYGENLVWWIGVFLVFSSFISYKVPLNLGFGSAGEFVFRAV